MSQNKNETKLAANQKFRATWLVMENGRKVVEKRISKECGKEALVQIGKILDKQIKLAGELTIDELRQIILFQEKDENENEIVYRRPYIEGETLAQKIKSGPFKTLDAVELILKIGRIVSVAHTKGIVHGDLKPENIMIAQDSSVCIIDWDTMKINRKIGDAQHVTMTQEESAGTPEYMDPEQCKGMQADKQSDVYALGLILYAMLAGRTPYTEMKPLEILDKKHTPIENIASDLKIDLMLSSTIEDALKKERNYRIQTVSEFLSRIDQCGREDVPVKPQVPSKQEDTPSAHSVDDPLDKIPKYNFVLIGHSGAGKTVLAGGLYSYAGESFAVEADSPQTRKNADNLKTLLITHQWPNHTGRGVSEDFSFFIYKNQKNVASISFPEYAGEDINQPRYCDNYLKNVDAVALLLNPNILEKDDHERIDRLSRLKECIRYLSRLPIVPPVAFLITASDRLETDLKDKRAEFEKYAKEIMVSLNANKVPAKRFDVSVTGKLEIQSEDGGSFKPVSEVTPINIDAPFIWLLDYLDHQEKLRAMRKYFKTIGIPVIVFAVVLLVLLVFFFKHSKGQQGMGVGPQQQQQTGQTQQQANAGVTTNTTPSTQKQLESSVALENADHIHEIEAINPSNISAIKSAISKYQGNSNDKAALIELIKRMIDSRIADMDARYNKLSPEEKNNWRTLSNILKTGINPEMESIVASFPECENYLNPKISVYQQSVVNTFIASENIKVDILDIASDSKAFILENKASNPYFENVTLWFFAKVSSICQSFYNTDPHDLTKQDFIYVKEICEAINPRRNGMPFPSDHQIAVGWKDWSKKYLDWKDKNNQYTLDFINLQARVKYSKPDDPYLGRIVIRRNDNKLFDFNSDGWNTTRFNSNYKSFQTEKLPSPQKYDLGDYLYLHVKIYDQKGVPDELKDTFDIYFYPGIDDPQCLEQNGTNADIKLDLNIDPFSQVFKSWKNQNPLPTK